MISRTTYRTHFRTWLKAPYLNEVLAVGLALVLTHALKLRPTLFTNSTGKAMIFDHAFHVQIFHANSIIAINKLSRNLVQIVATLVSYFLMQFAYYQTLLFTISRTTGRPRLLLTSKATLLNTEAFQVAGKEFLVLKLLSLRSDQKRLNTQIQAYRRGWINWFGFSGLDGQVYQNRDKILSGWGAAYRRGFDLSLKLSAENTIYPFAFGQKHFSIFKVTAHPLRQLERLFAMLAFESRKRCAVAEEVSESVVQIAQRHLQGLCWYFVKEVYFLLCISKLLVQLKISQRYAPHTIGCILGFQPRVVNQTATTKRFFQNGLLFFTGKQGVFVSA